MAKKDIEHDEMEAAEASGPRVYELGFHLDPELPTEEVKKAYQGIRDLVEEKGELVAEGEPLMTQLAYMISRQEPSGRRDFNSGYFCWLAYQTSVANHDEVLAAAKADSRIVRFIDLVTTKEAARHAAELRELSLKSDPSESGEPQASAAALDAALENAAL